MRTQSWVSKKIARRTLLRRSQKSLVFRFIEVGKTGLVGVLRQGNETCSIGLRADMDALLIHEQNNPAHCSTHKGTMHACGHDGHTVMLLAAAKYLAQTKSFLGQVNFIFQPAEEGLGGALAMIEDGLFERFPCDRIYAMHNGPGLPVGVFATVPGCAWPQAHSLM